MKSKILTGGAALFMLMLFTFQIYGQQKPIIQYPAYFDKTPPLKEMPPIYAHTKDQSWKDGVVRNEGNPFSEAIYEPDYTGPDPALQSAFGTQLLNEPTVNFEGTPNQNNVYPPDTDGDIGPNHYFQMINLVFQIFDREGNSLFGPFSNSMLWSGFIGPWTGTNDGDPIILYDDDADRWMASQFAINTSDGTYWELIAVSASPDPLGEWYRYAYQYDAFNDYPKMGVWPDAYYCTFNMFGDVRRVAVSAYEREAMLAGDPDARAVTFDMVGNPLPWSMLPADYDGPAPPEGTPNYVMYARDDATWPTDDQLSVWEFKVNWEDPASSTFEEVSVLDTEPMDFILCEANRQRCVDQPEDAPRLKGLPGRLMYRLVYRNFGDYQVLLANHTVDADGFGKAGIRWYELRDNFDGQGWYIYQQGTYAPDENHRWMGSIAMDKDGNIALGFTVSSVDKYPSIHYTGRSPNAPLGQMSFYEEELMAGGGSQFGEASRWGDYSKMSLDPLDDKTFWYTSEYYSESGGIDWQTRVGAFALVEDLVPPDPVTDLMAMQTATNAIALEWTATGDDGSDGKAFLYDIRYAHDEITAENFEQATAVSNELVPQSPGSTEHFVVEGLEYNTHYYFALKVRDKQFNFSTLSNNVDETTLGSPALWIGEDPIEQKMFPGSVGSRPWVVDNQGESDIYYRIYKDTLSTGDIPPGGAVLGTLENTAMLNMGSVWVEDKLYMVELFGSKLVRYDTMLQEITDSWEIHSSPYGIAWDGEHLWVGNSNGQIYEYDTNGMATGDMFTVQYKTNNAFTWNGSHFIVAPISKENPMIYWVRPDGTVDKKLASNLGGMQIWAFAWADDHYPGKLYFTNNSSTIGQFNVNDGLELLRTFDAPGVTSSALAHDGNNLLYGSIGGTTTIVDDGFYEVPWLRIEPFWADIQGESNRNIELFMEAGDLESGTRYAYLYIQSNDPAEPDKRIPLFIQEADVDLGPDTSFCGHLDILLDAGDGFHGYEWTDGSIWQTYLVDSAGYGLGHASIWVEVTDIGGLTGSDTILINFEDCTSIIEFDEDVSIQVYPNPSDGMVELVLSKPGETIGITVLDLQGKIIFEDVIRAGNSAALHHQIDLTRQASGTYLLKLNHKENIRTQRLIIR